MEIAQHPALFVGDSPNDETMFGYFTYSVGVANIQESLACEFQRPTFVTKHKGGKGFTEVVNYLLQTKASPHHEEVSK